MKIVEMIPTIIAGGLVIKTSELMFNNDEKLKKKVNKVI